MKVERVLTVAGTDRLAVVLAVVEKRLLQKEAAVRLGLDARQVKRLAKRCREHGAAGLGSGHRGRVPNNALGDEVRSAALAAVRERHADFGPTPAAEEAGRGARSVGVARESKGTFLLCVDT